VRVVRVCLAPTRGRSAPRTSAQALENHGQRALITSLRQPKEEANDEAIGSALVTAGVLLLASVGPASAQVNVDNASCTGLGSSFYGQFGPQQRAFVSLFVNETAIGEGVAPGETYSMFGQEKEGGSIPSPFGARLE
jgi:hypothetical protein